MLLDTIVGLPVAARRLLGEIVMLSSIKTLLGVIVGLTVALKTLLGLSVGMLVSADTQCTEPNAAAVPSGQFKQGNS